MELTGKEPFSIEGEPAKRVNAKMTLTKIEDHED